MQNHDFTLYYIPATHLQVFLHCNEMFWQFLTILNEEHKEAPLW